MYVRSYQVYAVYNFRLTNPIFHRNIIYSKSQTHKWSISSQCNYVKSIYVHIAHTNFAHKKSIAVQISWYFTRKYVVNRQSSIQVRSFVVKRKYEYVYLIA